MNRNSIFTAMACAGLALAASSSPLRAQLKPEDLYTAVSPSVVTLEVENVAGKHFLGNAFLAVGDGLAITAWHVVHDARHVEARFADHERVVVTGLVDKNEKLDVALIKLERAAHPQIKLSATTPRIGSRVYLVGSPRGLDFSISEGLISQIRTMDGVRYYQLSCPISPGDSGGPVLNERGEAVGVVSWRKADAENVGFAVPCEAMATLNQAAPALAWSQAVSASPFPSSSHETTPLVRAAVAAPSQNEADTFASFQKYLSRRAGQRVTIIVQEPEKETRFNFEVPKKQAAK